MKLVDDDRKQIQLPRCDESSCEAERIYRVVSNDGKHAVVELTGTTFFSPEPGQSEEDFLRQWKPGACWGFSYDRKTGKTAEIKPITGQVQ